MAGDFASLKELVTAFQEARPVGSTFPVRETLIRAYQYLIAKFDVDGFRIDTLKFIEPEFARALRERRPRVRPEHRKAELPHVRGGVRRGGENRAVHRAPGGSAGRVVGVDAALDFPLFFQLPAVVKGFTSPQAIERVYRQRKDVQRNLLTSHGEASSHFVTFLDNHDMRERVYFWDAAAPARFDDQLVLGLVCLFTLQGIPCLYYGTEQGLAGRGSSDQAVREALWGRPGGFNTAHPFYQAVRRLATVRREQPALRYGRQYFRPLSGNGIDFGLSAVPAGVLAFSRILNDQEVVVVANTNTMQGFSGEVIVDAALNPDGASYALLFSNKTAPHPPGAVRLRAGGSVTIHEPDERVTRGPARTVPLTLQPTEAQIFRQATG